jgi:post-segregation antitoxin (ccd killing protein)
LDFLVKEVKLPALNMSKKLKEAMSKELKKTKNKMSQLIESINKENKIIKETK